MCIDWIKNAFLKEETKVALVGLQKSGKTTFLDTVLVSKPRYVYVSKLPSLLLIDYCSVMLTDLTYLKLV